MEEEVVQTFFGLYQNEHSNAKLKECGIFLDKELTCGSSPDRIIFCDCCGASCLEVKCPISISFTSSTSPRFLIYLVSNGDMKHISESPRLLALAHH